jgi:thiamine biosynthesis lipoprotein
MISELEQQMSAYRNDSELTRLNQRAPENAVSVEAGLFALLQLSRRLSLATEGAFDPTSGPLVALWRDCRNQDRIPTNTEISACLERVGIEHVQFDEANKMISFARAQVELNLGGIGKGYALDRAGAYLVEQGIDEWLLHGGRSSLLARGRHNQLDGWPVGIGNPLFTGKRLGTILLNNCAMATSGSNIQFFRHAGRKYGHILDPRTGWPIETMLSVTVLASTAAEADALSTAFYVMGVEKTVECCASLAGVSALLIPFPTGRQLEPVVVGIPDDRLFLSADQIVAS